MTEMVAPSIYGILKLTRDCRDALKEPHLHVRKALELLENETNDNLPEGQLRLQAADTLSQLEGFMKTVGCQM